MCSASTRWSLALVGGWLAATLVLSTNLPAQDWTRFRGPNGTGVSTSRKIPVEWAEGDYNWKTALPGIGHSSPGNLG